MGYGEYGGGGSIQSAVWLSEPDTEVTQLTKGPEAWKRLSENQLSRRARAFIQRIEETDLTFFGEDETPSGLGNFKVRLRFQDETEIRRAAAAFEKAIGGKCLEVEFLLAAVKYSPGQIKLAWDKHANENLGDDSTQWNGIGGGPRRRGLIGLLQRLLRIFR